MSDNVEKDIDTLPADWYLIYTKPLKEQVALRNLQRQAYTAYLPMMNRNKRVRGKMKSVSEPMFSRYLFVQLAMGTDNIAPIRSTLGVTDLVRFGQEPAKLPAQFVARLQQDELALLQKPEGPRFQAGDKVTIADGPFKGYEAMFEAQKSSDRAIILLDIASRYTRLQIQSELLDKVI